jgi:hypothetical protein
VPLVGQAVLAVDEGVECGTPVRHWVSDACTLYRCGAAFDVIIEAHIEDELGGV